MNGTDAVPVPVRKGNPFSIAVGTLWGANMLFLAGMASFPGGDYNPCLRMLSALGRTQIRLVSFPLCTFLFVAGMVVSALGVWLISRRVNGTRVFRLGAGLNALGLLCIAAVPENVNGLGHNAGCWLAALGGGLMWWGASLPHRRLWGFVLLVPCLLMGTGLVLHGVGLVPFSPWVPTAQKLILLAFMSWCLALTWPFRSPWRMRVACLLALVLVGVAVHVLSPARPPSLALEGVSAERSPGCATEPLSEDELAGLRWLEFVTGRMSAADEKEWWAIGGRQFGIFAKRYQIAFSGYAAAAIGFRAAGDSPEAKAIRRRVGQVLGNCLTRYLRPEVWGYSQAKSYWGLKPWAPDPCYRENVMYTGHLLQLLAYYELFTGDTRYWSDGFDFEWKGRRVHYDVKKLIDVTTEQMRKGPSGGVTCEPGLLFFPCNNHPHVALSVFARLGHGDWTKDARRWECWALAHFHRPFFGGGALNLVCHVRSGILYPRGSAGLDAWSLLWYEPWAADRRVAKALWREAARAIDWSRIESVSDVGPVRDCADPEPAAPSVTAAFLAAAARACDDPDTALRLERALDARYLSRRNGWYFLDVSRAWRIGATAQRLISLAESHGARFRFDQ